MKRTSQLTLSCVMLSLWACVTVNVYFPAAAAEQAADSFIREVYDVGKAQGAKDPGVPEGVSPDGVGTQPQGLWQPKRENNITNMPTRNMVAVLDFMVSSAAAQQPNINVGTPAINKLKGRMRSRHGQLGPFYQNGAIGMAANGLLVLRAPGAVSLAQRNRVNGLVAEENRDRSILYGEIARANGHPEWESEIRNIFARRWIGNAPGGWWFQSGGGWRQK